ncbi:MAG: ComEC/Rec2 family competence protein, partial [Chloroflexota bacterium]
LLLPLGLLWLYSLLSAFSPSVERAAIMATLYLLAVALGRQRNALPALGFAAAVMVAVEPGVLYSLSFQLSFTAMAGILLLWRPIEALMTAGLERILPSESWWRAVAGWGLTSVAVSIAAVVATLPLLAFNFHYIALLSVPATLLALPALPLVLVTSLAAALAGLVAPILGHVTGWVAWLPLSYTLWVVELLSRLPGTVLHLGSVSGVLVWAYYGVAAALALALSFLGRMGRRRLAMLLPWRGDSRQPQGFERSNWPVAKTGALLSLAAVVVLVWTADASLPDGKLHVDFLDVGQGDAIFIQTPEGRQILVDGGPDPGRLLEALGKRMPFWDRTLDVIVLTHAHDDHLAGLLEVLRRYRVAVVVDNPCPSDCPLYAAWRSLVDMEEAKVLEATEGQTIKLGGAITLEVLNPPAPPLAGTSSDVGNNATVVCLRYGGVSFLLTGDLQWEGEASLIDRGAALGDTVLKVAHHGSASSSSQEFLDSVRPLLAVVSVGKVNRYGHPNQDVMAHLATATGGPGSVLTTMQHGNIGIVSDGQRVIVHTER